jgi:cytochrome c oxidase subunit 2
MTIGIWAARGRGVMGLAGAAIAPLMAMASGAVAQEGPVVGRGFDNQIGLIEGLSPIAHEIDFFHNVILLPIITVISLFVAGLLVYVIIKFNEKANPTPSKTTHHTGLEVAWTIVPVLILVAIAIPSFRLLTHQLVLPDGDVTVKATGKQWYWSYAYPKDASGAGGFEFDSNILDQTKLPAGKLRLLDVDNEAVVPVGKTIRMQVTADAVGVIHSFVLQSFGIRVDAVPGRLNETWFKAEREGVYYGECSKLCGKDHAFMPIVFRVVSEEKYKEWLAQAAKDFASSEGPVKVADNVPTTSRQ